MCKICDQTTQFMKFFKEKKTCAEFQSHFGLKNAKLEQLSSLFLQIKTSNLGLQDILQAARAMSHITLRGIMS